LADAGGKIRRIAGGLRPLGNVATCSKLCEGQIRVDLTPFVEELIQVAVNEQSPVQAPACARVLRVTTNRSRAVLRQGIIPSRMVDEPINFLEIINQQSPRL